MRLEPVHFEYEVVDWSPTTDNNSSAPDGALATWEMEGLHSFQTPLS